MSWILILPSPIQIAITKDLDYLGSTVDELYAEKSDLLQQLEDERAKNQRQLEDLNVLMDKMKANADNARDQSFAVDQYKAEFEVIAILIIPI